MKKNTTFSKLIQNFLSDDEMSKIAASIGFADTARKLTIRVLIEYMVMAAACEWKSLRYSSDVGAAAGLIHVDYSALSKKLKQLDFRFMKEVFALIAGKCNRVTRRTIKIPNQLLL
ncbi:hypothetical protein [Bacillus sp. 37MA]|uniref:hypothetical protein n=1 Tax=Bacillus sp. 37MA TaxID=1132442 RepID=UPI0003626033|nr:hypothetical protein [Bacillus sp. 37MA]